MQTATPIERGGWFCFNLLRLFQLFCESDKKSFRTANVAESIDVLILNYFANKLCAVLF